MEETGSQPFTSGRWLFAHNGRVEGWSVDPAVKAALRRSLSDKRAAGIEGVADSEVLFALALDRLDGGASPAAALAAVIAVATAVAPSMLNLLLTDGHRVTATACGDSLFVLERRRPRVATRWSWRRSRTTTIPAGSGWPRGRWSKPVPDG